MTAIVPARSEPIDTRASRRAVLSPVDRVSEMLFGLFMALTFVGAISVAESGRAEVRDLLVAALACNLAWGLVDAVMFLIQGISDRGRSLALVRAVRADADAASARARLRDALPESVSAAVGDAELESMRTRIAALPEAPGRPTLTRDDLVGALGVFLIVVAATFPVVVPFLVLDDLAWAKGLSRVVALAMLFVGGLALGRYAGYGSWKAGLLLTGLGTVLVAVIIALGG
jgi:hypothetical protein